MPPGIWRRWRATLINLQRWRYVNNKGFVFICGNWIYLLMQALLDASYQALKMRISSMSSRAPPQPSHRLQPRESRFIIRHENTSVSSNQATKQCFCCCEFKFSPQGVSGGGH